MNDITDNNHLLPLFQVGQRVRILPNKNYPPTKAKGGIRYGIIQGKTQHPGMNLMNVQLPNGNNGTNAKGEWAYVVASYASPNAGAMWFTAAGLQPMKRAAKIIENKV